MILGGMVTLFVRDVAHSVRFYIETLGMKLVSEAKDASVLDAGDGFLIQLRSGHPRGEAPVPLVTFFAKVPLAQAIAIYENRGVVFDRDGRFADPDGNALCLVQRPET